MKRTGFTPGMANIELSKPLCDLSVAFRSRSNRKETAFIIAEAPLLGRTRSGKYWGYRLMTSPIAAVETSMLSAIDVITTFRDQRAAAFSKRSLVQGIRLFAETTKSLCFTLTTRLGNMSRLRPVYPEIAPL